MNEQFSRGGIRRGGRSYAGPAAVSNRVGKRLVRSNGQALVLALDTAADRFCCAALWPLNGHKRCL